MLDTSIPWLCIDCTLCWYAIGFTRATCVPSGLLTVLVIRVIHVAALANVLQDLSAGLALVIFSMSYSRAWCCVCAATKCATKQSPIHYYCELCKNDYASRRSIQELACKPNRTWCHATEHAKRSTTMLLKKKKEKEKKERRKRKRCSRLTKTMSPS